MKLEWSKPRKSDKGAIVLHLDGQFNLMLWSKDGLDEWMFMINESIARNKVRKSCLNKSNVSEGCKMDGSDSQAINEAISMPNKPAEGNDVYENFVNISVRPDDDHPTKKPIDYLGQGKPCERGQDPKLTMTISQARETSEQLTATR